MVGYGEGKLGFGRQGSGEGGAEELSRTATSVSKQIADVEERSRGGEFYTCKDHIQRARS